jgi:hypothetical protein
MATIRTTVSLLGTTWQTVGAIARECIALPYLPHSPRILHDMASDAMAERRERADIWQTYRACSVCGLSGDRVHGDTPDCDAITVEVMMTTAQARRIMEWADTLHDGGLTFTENELACVRAFANDVATAHDMAPITR